MAVGWKFLGSKSRGWPTGKSFTPGREVLLILTMSGWMGKKLIGKLFIWFLADVRALGMSQKASKGIEFLSIYVKIFHGF